MSGERVRKECAGFAVVGVASETHTSGRIAFFGVVVHSRVAKFVCDSSGFYDAPGLLLLLRIGPFFTRDIPLRHHSSCCSFHSTRGSIK